jgi:hypothetical protein
MMGGIKSYSEEHEMRYWKCDFSVTKYILEGFENSPIRAALAAAARQVRWRSRLKSVLRSYKSLKRFSADQSTHFLGHVVVVWITSRQQQQQQETSRLHGLPGGRFRALGTSTDRPLTGQVWPGRLRC